MVQNVPCAKIGRSSRTCEFRKIRIIEQTWLCLLNGKMMVFSDWDFFWTMVEFFDHLKTSLLFFEVLSLISEKQVKQLLWDEHLFSVHNQHQQHTQVSSNVCDSLILVRNISSFHQWLTNQLPLLPEKVLILRLNIKYVMYRDSKEINVDLKKTNVWREKGNDKHSYNHSNVLSSISNKML